MQRNISEVPVDEPRPSPFKLNRTRLFLLVMGAIILAIAISTAMGGLSAYQQLKEANAAAKEAVAEQGQ